MKTKIFLLVFLFLAAGTVFNTTNAQPQLYGLLSAGGGYYPDSLGAIFHYTPTNGMLAIDTTFTLTKAGISPQADLTEGGNGKLYGLTSQGGNNSYSYYGAGGVLFEWNPANNSYTKKFDFDGLNGAAPYGSLTLSGGKLYGMTSFGGTGTSPPPDYYPGKGVIFEWDLASETYTKKFDFDTTNGENPTGSLCLKDGKFYGMTEYGGASGNGVIFEWDPVTNIFIKKIDFNWIDGSHPKGSLVLYAGKFYGMTRDGGALGNGVIFEWDPTTNLYIKKIDFDETNGRYPEGSLTYSGSKFYGMTTWGGSNNVGVIFDWDPVTNVYKKKFDFGGENGVNPYGSFTSFGDKLYGMTSTSYYGGDVGVLFEWDPASDDGYAKKLDFNGTNGANPHGSLTSAGGKLYGMTGQGGAGYGVIFEWEPIANIYIKKTSLGIANGSTPKGSLTLFGEKMYGMTYSGGEYDSGVIFEFDFTTNAYLKKFDFTGLNGSFPQGSLTMNGVKLYGMTTNGGLFDCGVIFEWDPITNIYTKKYDFDTIYGRAPYGALTMSGGKFYGMTRYGGTFDYGVLFEWDPVSNIYVKKIDFDESNGREPFGSLTLNGGKLYGLTSLGGVFGNGVLFEWNPTNNTYSKKYNFQLLDGANPNGSLTLNGGKFYGMTRYGGANSIGVIFEWNPVSNIYTKKIDFEFINGAYPRGSLTVSGGKFYGMTTNGGINYIYGYYALASGVLFEWDPATNIYTKKIDFDGYSMGGTPEFTQLLEYIPCTNPVAGGNIASNQNGCSPFNPNVILSTASASGYGGTLQYKWQSSVSPFTTWTDIDSNSLTFDPGVILVTTKFKRLARVECIADWADAAETNVVTMTVNQSPSVILPATQTICSGSPTTVANLTSNVLSATFTWSVSPLPPANITGYTQFGTGNIGVQTIFNTSSGPYNLTYHIIPTSSQGGGCPGIPADYIITVNPNIQINQPTSQTICNGGTTTPIVFWTNNTVGTTTYSWVNNSASIGLASSGMGDIPPFVATNLGTSPIIATIIVTPSFSYGGVTCLGLSKSFTITVTPTAQVNQPANQVVCNGESTVPITFYTSNTIGTTTYSWVNNSISIGLANTGMGSIPSFTATNFGTSPITSTITVTPHYSYGGVSCEGFSKVFTISVSPTAQVNQPTDQVVCNGATTSLVEFTTNNMGGTTTYLWTHTNPSIGLASSGIGNINPFVGINNSNVPQVSYISVTPVYSSYGTSCSGPPNTFSITVNPMVVGAGNITGLATVYQGQTNVEYSVLPILNASSYVWELPSGVLGTSSTNVINLSFPNTSLSGNITVKGHNGCGDGLASSLQIEVFKHSEIKLLLEGLYSPATGAMNKSQDANGAHFSSDIADRIDLELHNSNFPYTIAFSANDLDLKTEGSISFSLPSSFNNSYYIVVKHRNHIETWSKNPVSCSGETLNYDFRTSATKAFGDNLKMVSSGNYALYAGDVDNNGLINETDINTIQSNSSVFSTGYITPDVNGDGIIDALDLIITDNNAAKFISVMKP